MNGTAPNALAKPSTSAPQGDRLTTPGKPSAAGPTSDVATNPRANMPPPNLKGNAREAARRAAEAARNGASVPDALEQAKAPRGQESAAPAAAGQEQPQLATSPELADTPAEVPEVENPIDVRTRVRQREQRMQRELAEREQRISAREAELSQLDSRARQVLDRHAQLENLRKTDVGKWAQEIGLDEATLKPIVMGRIAANKPEGQVLTLEQKVAQMEAREREREQQAQQQQQNAQRQQSEQTFLRMATDAAKYPTVAAVYADEPGELVREAWALQNRFQREFRRMPTQEEIAVNLERMVKDRAQRAAKVLGSVPTVTPAPATTPPAPKPKAPSPSEQARTAPTQRTERIETDRERRERAAKSARQAIAGANKRNQPTR